MLIAQISDCHITAPEIASIRGVHDPAGTLAQCVAHIGSLERRPDVVLATGDLVHDGSAESYAVLRDLLVPLTMPVYLIPGNHDDRDNLRAAFPDHDYLPRSGEFLHYVVEDYPLRLVGLDTIVPGATGGLMCEERQAWLDARLAEAPDRPTLIFMHHPPFRIGIPGMDELNCAESEALGEIVARHPQIQRIVAGHVHRPAVVGWHGTVVSTAPSSAAQLQLSFEDGAKLAFLPEPLACPLHFWQPQAGLVTHLSFVGNFGPAANA